MTPKKAEWVRHYASLAILSPPLDHSIKFGFQKLPRIKDLKHSIISIQNLFLVS